MVNVVRHHRNTDLAWTKYNINRTWLLSYVSRVDHAVVINGRLAFCKRKKPIDVGVNGAISRHGMALSVREINGESHERLQSIVHYGSRYSLAGRSL